jgi:hypothetical protein
MENPSPLEALLTWYRTGRRGKDRCLARDRIEHRIVVVAHSRNDDQVVSCRGYKGLDEEVVKAATLEAVGALRAGGAVVFEVFVLVNVSAAEQVGHSATRVLPADLLIAEGTKVSATIV